MELAAESSRQVMILWWMERVVGKTEKETETKKKHRDIKTVTNKRDRDTAIGTWRH